MKRIATTMLFACSLSVSMALPAIASFNGGQEAYLMKDYAKAMKEFKADDDPRSLYRVGYMYDHGEGVQQDGKEAAVWFRKAAEKGYALAQYRLGVIYENGYGVERDMKEATKWYQQAANKGLQAAKDALKRIQGAK